MIYQDLETARPVDYDQMDHFAEDWQLHNEGVPSNLRASFRDVMAPGPDGEMRVSHIIGETQCEVENACFDGLPQENLIEGQLRDQRFQNLSPLEVPTASGDRNHWDMEQNGVRVQRLGSRILCNGLEVVHLAPNEPAHISQVNKSVYVNDRLVFGIGEDDDGCNDTCHEPVLQCGPPARIYKIQRIGCAVIVDGLEVARHPQEEPAEITQCEGQVFLNGTRIYPRGVVTYPCMPCDDPCHVDCHNY